MRNHQRREIQISPAPSRTGSKVWLFLYEGIQVNVLLATISLPAQYLLTRDEHNLHMHLATELDGNLKSGAPLRMGASWMPSDKIGCHGLYPPLTEMILNTDPKETFLCKVFPTEFLIRLRFSDLHPLQEKCPSALHRKSLHQITSCDEFCEGHNQPGRCLLSAWLMATSTPKIFIWNKAAQYTKKHHYQRLCLLSIKNFGWWAVIDQYLEVPGWWLSESVNHPYCKHKARFHTAFMDLKIYKICHRQ